MKIKRPKGRPTIDKRTQLSEAEMKYARLRAHGSSPAAASREIGRPLGEMVNMEENLLILKQQIFNFKQELLNLNYMEFSSLYLKILSNLNSEIQKRLEEGNLKIEDISKYLEALHNLKRDQQALLSKNPIVTTTTVKTNQTKPKLVAWLEEQHQKDLESGEIEEDIETTTENKGKTLKEWWKEEYPEKVKPIKRTAILKE